MTGILVDDAIVEIENIVRHMRMGKSAYRASLEAADEIGLAVIAISLSIAAIFSPVSFMGGIAGQYFRQFGLTVAIAVMFSLLVARFITPVIAAYFMRAPRHDEHEDGAVDALLYAAGARLGALALGDPVRRRADLRRVAVVDAAAAVRASSPPTIMARALLAIELPPGSRLDDTDRVTREISDKLKAMPEVRSVMVFGGQILGGAVRAAQGELRHQFRPQVEARGDAEGLADSHLRDPWPT